MRILFVETQETFARVVIGAFLKNHEVAVRTTVSWAREELSSYTYDAALVAFEMEDGNGVELVNTSVRPAARCWLSASRPETRRTTG